MNSTLKRPRLPSTDNEEISSCDSDSSRQLKKMKGETSCYEHEFFERRQINADLFDSTHPPMISLSHQHCFPSKDEISMHLWQAISRFMNRFCSFGIDLTLITSNILFMENLSTKFRHAIYLYRNNSVELQHPMLHLFLDQVLVGVLNEHFDQYYRHSFPHVTSSDSGLMQANPEAMVASDSFDTEYLSVELDAELSDFVNSFALETWS